MTGAKNYKFNKRSDIELSKNTLVTKEVKSIDQLKNTYDRVLTIINKNIKGL